MSLPIGISYYFPNFTLRLVRSHHPPHIATFKCSKQATKPDIKSYLEQVYNIKISDIRTMIYNGKFKPKPINGRMVKVRRPGYKKAIVVMNEDFVFPDVDDKAQKLPDLNSANRVHGKGSHFNFELSRWRKFHNRKGDQAVEGEKK